MSRAMRAWCEHTSPPPVATDDVHCEPLCVVAVQTFILCFRPESSSSFLMMRLVLHYCVVLIESVQLLELFAENLFNDNLYKYLFK